MVHHSNVDAVMGKYADVMKEIDGNRAKTEVYAEIEGIIEQELAEHAVEEADVLKGMTAVYTARRLGTLKLSEAGGFDEQASEKKKRYKANRLRKEAAKNGV